MNALSKEAGQRGDMGRGCGARVIRTGVGGWGTWVIRAGTGAVACVMMIRHQSPMPPGSGPQGANAAPCGVCIQAHRKSEGPGDCAPGPDCHVARVSEIRLFQLPAASFEFPSKPLEIRRTTPRPAPSHKAAKPEKAPSISRRAFWSAAENRVFVRRVGKQKHTWTAPLIEVKGGADCAAPRAECYPNRSSRLTLASLACSARCAAYVARAFSVRSGFSINHVATALR